MNHLPVSYYYSASATMYSVGKTQLDNQIFNSFSCSSCTGDKSMLLAWLAEEHQAKKMNILPSWITGFWYDLYDEHKSVWATFKTTGTACMWCIQHYLWVTASVTLDRRPETIVRTQTNATKISLARMKDAQALLVDGQPASGSHDKRTSPTNLQPPTAPAIGSGGNKLSLRCCRCSPSRHATGIQKQNLTDQEKGVVSSLSVCERPDFFKTRWWAKNFFWWKLAQGPSQHLVRNKKLHTAFSFCT